MRFYLTLSCLILACLRASSAHAQTIFAPTGTEWWYYVATVGGPYMAHVESVGDTLVAGQPGAWKALRCQRYSYVGNGRYTPAWQPFILALTQVRGQQVWAVQHSGVPFLYLDFTIPAGTLVDSIDYCPSGNPVSGTAAHVIDSVGLTTVNGQQIRYQSHKVPAVNNWERIIMEEFTGRVLEGVGYPNALMFPILRCGTDPELPRLQYFSDGVLSFGTLPIITGQAEEAAVFAGVTISPNPAADGLFQVSGFAAETVVTYDVLDVLGQRVCAGTLAAGSMLNLAECRPGVYWLHTEAAGKRISRRLVRL